MFRIKSAIVIVVFMFLAAVAVFAVEAEIKRVYHSYLSEPQY